MPSYVLQDQTTKQFLKKTDAWGYTLTDDLQQARVYITDKDARRTASNKPRYADEKNLPDLVLVEIKLILA